MDTLLSPESAIDLIAVRGPAVNPYISDAARLRTEIFREFPYLYEGTAEAEAAYLQSYIDAPHSYFVVALEKTTGRAVGLTTFVPMPEADPVWQAPYQAAGWDLHELAYFGESVLAQAWRGRGLGRAFMKARLDEARRLGHRYATFCAVLRDVDDPRRPSDYRPLDAFWQRCGFEPDDSLIAHLKWPTTDSSGDVSHQLRFWRREV